MAQPPLGYASAPPARRRRRWPRRLLIAVLVLAVLFVAVDRVGLIVAERVAGTRLQDSQHLEHRPDVSVTGFPFLTQLAEGNFDEITITAKDQPIGPAQRTLTVDSLVVHLHDVTIPHDFAAIHAATATADAHIGYAQLSKTLGATVSYDGPNDGGRIKASASVTVLKVKLGGSISVAVRASAATGLSFVDPQVRLLDQDVPSLDTALKGIFATPISLAGLPFHIQVTGVDVTAGGVLVHLSGRDLEYRKAQT